MRSCWAVGVLVLLLLTRAGLAATSSINPMADAFVDSATSPTDRTSQNFGGAGSLGVAGSAAANGSFLSVLRFDLSSTKTLFDSTYGAGKWTITSASVQLAAQPPNNGIFNSPSVAGQVTALWQQDDSWIEGSGSPSTPGATGITWSTLPAYVGAGDETIGSFAFTNATSGFASYSLTLTSGFTADMSAGNLVSLRMAPADSTVAVLFASTNNPNSGGALRPVLTINAVPEPGSALLILTVLGIAPLRRRR